MKLNFNIKKKSYYEPNQEIKISAKIHFVILINFDCLYTSEINVTEFFFQEVSKTFKDIFTNVEETEINNLKN
jgi:hypothetical protein